MNDQSIIHFYFKKGILLANRKALKAFLSKQILQNAKTGAKINFIFCSDEALLQINKEYLRHDYYTDIITFDLSENAQFLISDIYISVDRVRENAKLHEKNPSHELHRVIFHGVLHLLGYKDKSAKNRKEMQHMEDLWLDEYSKPFS